MRRILLLTGVLALSSFFPGLARAGGNDGVPPALSPSTPFLPSWNFSGVGDPVPPTSSSDPLADHAGALPQSSSTTTGMLSSGLAHAGNRIFLEPLIVKDGDIDNQLTLMPAYGGMPGRSSAFTTPIMLEKRLTHRFRLRVDTHYIDFWTPGKGYSGFPYAGLQG